jgi:ankyrin repeat protein
VSLLLANGADPNPARGVLEDGSIKVSTLQGNLLSKPECRADMLEIKRIMDSTFYATPLHKACAENDLEALRDILKALQRDKSMVDLKDNDGWTPLHVAVFLGSMDSVRLLLDSNADPFARTNTGLTALHLACSRRGSPVVVSTCMKLLAGAIAKNKQGCTYVSVSDVVTRLRCCVTMEEAKTIFETFIKVLSNIQKNPEVEKFRNLKKSNPVVASTLLLNAEAEQLLLYAGFEIKESTIELNRFDIHSLGLIVEVLEIALDDLTREWSDMY